MTLSVLYAYFGIHVVSGDELVELSYSVIDNDPSDSPFFWGTTPPDSVEYILNGNDHIDIGASTFNGNFVNGGAGEDMIFGGSGKDELLGDLGDDTLAGNDGDDILDGGVGDDDIDGGLGNDTLQGWTGGDSLRGGEGNDQLYGHTGDDELLGGDGDDVVSGGTGNDEIAGGSGIDKLMGDQGADMIRGEDGNDDIRGGADNDALAGDGGNDVIRGHSGDDQIDGGTGNDELRGGYGNDELAGYEGQDILTGGPGQNFFYYDETVSDSGKTASTRDIILGFNHGATSVVGQDIIDLYDLDASATAAGDQAFTFIGTAAFSAEGQLRVMKSGDNVIIQMNISGTLAADMTIQVNTDVVANFVATDFIL